MTPEPCPYCKGTGKQIIQPYPFEEWPRDKDQRVVLAKEMINCYFAWKADKEYKPPYNPDEHIYDIAHACAILETTEIISAEKKGAIITYLMSK